MEVVHQSVQWRKNDRLFQYIIGLVHVLRFWLI
jgi:hypothetical protein